MVTKYHPLERRQKLVFALTLASMRDQRLHLAHYTNTYQPVTSGVVRSVSTFRQALTELGHNVFIFAQEASDFEDCEPFIFRYPALDLPGLPDFPLTIPMSPFIDKVLPYLKLDLIHSHHPFLLGQTAAKKSKELKVPLVFTFHTRYQEYSHYVAIDQGLVKKAIGGWLGDYMQKCHHVVVPSEGIKQLLAERYGISGQVTVVPTGIDLTPYAKSEGQRVREACGWGDDLVLISIGRLALEKNWSTLLVAVAQVIAQHSQVRFVLLGDGSERESLEAQAADLGIADRVELTGNVPFEQVPDYLAAADLFCFASVTETQGLVTMEALAAGLPVVAVKATGTTDVLEPDRQGLLTDDNSAALAQAIQRLVENQALRQQFSQAALERAREFEMLAQAQKLLKVYERAIEDQKGGRYIRVESEEQVVAKEDTLFRLLGLSFLS